MRQKKTNQLSHDAQIAYLTYKKSESDPLVWAIRNINLPKGAQWDFEERRWQIQILESLASERRVVIKKPTQIGLTTMAMVGTLHYLNYHPATAMYTLPRRDDISDFVGSALNPIIQSSPHLQSIISDTDSVRLKKFRAQLPQANGETKTIESFLHLMEGSVEPRMIPVDLLINDEVDRSNQDYLEIFQARLDASRDPHHFQFSSPTLPGFGIDKLYADTTQNEWNVVCDACGKDQFLDWEQNFVAEPEPHYICIHCKETISARSILDGKWVALQPSKDIVGYHASHLMMPLSHPPRQLHEQSISGKMSKKNFYNLRLGLAYSPATTSLTREVLAQKCFDAPFTSEPLAMTMGMYYMGVDQGNDVHIVVVRKENRMFKIVAARKVPYKSQRDWNEEVVRLILAYRIRFCVVDFGPNTHDARKIWAAAPDRVALCQYSEIEELLRRDKAEGKVHVNKTESFDGLVQEITSGTWKIWGLWEVDQEPMRIVSHLSALQRDEVEKPDGQIKGVWRNNGADHYGHAIGYARIAMLLSNDSGFRMTSLDTPPEESEVADKARESASWKIWRILPPETEVKEPDEFRNLFKGVG